MRTTWLNDTDHLSTVTGLSGGARLAAAVLGCPTLATGASIQPQPKKAPWHRSKGTGAEDVGLQMPSLNRHTPPRSGGGGSEGCRKRKRLEAKEGSDPTYEVL